MGIKKLTIEEFDKLSDEEQNNYIDNISKINNNKLEEVKNEMATLKEEALAYEPQLTLNIADLDEVPVDLNVEDREGKDKEGRTFKYRIVTLNSKEYRVPNTVLEEIQKILKLKPSVTKVNVTKSGSGLGTKYKVDALD